MPKPRPARYLPSVPGPRYQGHATTIVLEPTLHPTLVKLGLLYTARVYPNGMGRYLIAAAAPTPNRALRQVLRLLDRLARSAPTSEAAPYPAIEYQA